MKRLFYQGQLVVVSRPLVKEKAAAVVWSPANSPQKLKVQKLKD